MIGFLGDIPIEASEDRMRTWIALSRSGAARWATHEVIAGKPKLEFIGPGLSSFSMTIHLDINRGVVPRDEVARFRANRDAGNALQFTVGGQLVGDYVIKEVGEDHKRVDKNGVVLFCVATLQLEEYT